MTFCPPWGEHRPPDEPGDDAGRAAERRCVMTLTPPLSSSSVPRGVSIRWQAHCAQSAKRSRAPFRSLTGGWDNQEEPGSRRWVQRSARRRAAVIPGSALAGVHTPTTAAQAIGESAQRSLLSPGTAGGSRDWSEACKQPRPHGRTVTSDRQIAHLERELAVCRRELGRGSRPWRERAQAACWG